MKTIGLIGGMTWQSTLQYYRFFNEMVHRRLGGSHSAKVVIANVDFDEVEQLQKAGAWDEAGELLLRHAQSLQRAGAEIVLIGANTMHKVAPLLEAKLSIPLLHVVDATAAAVKHRGCKLVGLLGTRYTMEQAFYRDRLTDRHQLGTIIPEADDRATIHRVIFEELQRGMLHEESREAFRGIIRKLVAQGADGVILGCTEIPLLINASDSPVPIFDTTAIHAQAAVDWALA
jgi:aspartate racemase